MQHAPQPGRQSNAGERGSRGAGEKVLVDGRLPPCSLSPLLPCASDLVIGLVIGDINDSEVAIGEFPFRHEPVDLAAHRDIQTGAHAVLMIGRVPGEQGVLAVDVYKRQIL